MDTVNFLEQLANNVFYSKELHTLIDQQPSHIQKAFSENNPEAIKNSFPNVGYLATGVAVIEL